MRLIILASIVVASCAILSAQDSEVFTVESARDLAVVPEGGVKRALLIATGRHINKRITPLAGVDPDVDLLRERLLDPRCGFQDENVEVLKTDDYPTLENITAAVDEFLDSCGPNDFAFLYLGGHGVRDAKAKVDYYVPFDAKPIIEEGKIASFESATCFSLQALRDKIERCDAKFKWVVVDACRANLDAKGDDDEWNAIDQLEAAEGSLWFQSCGKGQKSYEIAFSLDGKVVKHGMFTWYFCQGTEGAAANSAGLISPVGLFKYARKKMREARAKDRNIPEQEPLMSCQDLSDGEFVFVDVSDPDKVKAKKAYDEAFQFFLDGEYKKAQTAINAAVKLEPGNKTYQALKKRIDELVGTGDTDTPKPPVVDPPASSSWTGNFEAGTRRTLTYKGVEFAFRYCPAGSYTMGSPSSEKGRDNDEVQRSVTISEGFWICETETTQEQWDAVGVKKGYECKFKGAKLPVETVSWNESDAFIKKLNELGIAPKGWRFVLPTEEQWEYACRAGTTGSTYGVPLDEAAWYGESYSSGSTHKVGTKKPNKWGIFDMLGNVWEWTSSKYDDGSSFVNRGGGWSNHAQNCHPADRFCNSPTNVYFNLGARAALVRQSSK